MSSVQIDKLRREVQRIPDSPGVYLMKDESGRVVYIGKAKRLVRRVGSYFQKRDALDVKTRALVSSIGSIDYIATRNEVEALVLECNLIKEYRPKYNIRLKDDKRYPFIKLTLNEKFPRLLIVRRVIRDGAEYFGPYTDVKAVRRTMRLIGSIFPLRKCSGKHIWMSKKRECLNFHIKHCLGPCTGRVDEFEYGEIVKQVRLFIKGRSEELCRSLRHRMRYLSSQKRYEEAAQVRNQIESLERITQKQLAVSPGEVDEDIIAMARERSRSCGVVMKIREGKLLGSEAFLLPVSVTVKDAEVYDAFFELYYHSSTDIPSEILTQLELSDRDLLQKWLSGKAGRSVKIHMPKRGDKKRLVELARKNAALKIVSTTKPTVKSRSILGELKKTLGLHATPFRIEAYDISNIQGSDAVGSMVTFENGRPLKSRYRHFKIREVEGIDDFAMIREVLKRRLSHLKDGSDKAPDLILVDGGKGQVSSVRSVMNEMEIVEIPVVGLAKKHEELYMAGMEGVLRLSRESDVLRFLQRLRDEAHRFAVEYHRKVRSRRVERSELDGIPGIGEKRKTILLVEFGSLRELGRASIEEIASVRGIGGKIAERIFEYLHNR